MQAAFLQVLTMSFTASLVIGAVLLARCGLRKLPRVYSYLLWALVLFRLLCPTALSSEWSLIPPRALSLPQPPLAQAEQRAALEDYTVPVLDPTPASGAPADESASLLEKQAPRPFDWLRLFSFVWLAGAAGFSLAGAASLAGLRRRLVGAVLLGPGTYAADHISSPFVLGILRPKIYLPSSLAPRDTDMVLAHEKQHIRRKDPLWKLLFFTALCLHWFNPLVWLAFRLFDEDMEISCDEAVIQNFSAEGRAEYSSTLLRLAAGRRSFAVAPLAFGEGNLRRRVQRILQYHRPAFWVGLAGGCLVALLAVVLLTNPSSRSLPVLSLQENDLNPNEALYLQQARDMPEGTLFVGRTQEGYLVYYCHDQNHYSYFRLRAQTQDEMLRLYLTEEDAVSETYISDTLLVRLPFQGDIQHMEATLNGQSLSCIYDTSLFSGAAASAASTVQSASLVPQDMERLHQAIHKTALARAQELFPTAEVLTESHFLLSAEAQEDTVTAYAVVLSMSFEQNADGLRPSADNCAPAVFTFRVDSSEYLLQEYQMPEQEAESAAFIEEYFPAGLTRDALNGTRYLPAQRQECYRQAVEATGFVPAPLIEQYLQAICEGPAASSSLEEYLNSAPEEHRELLNYGDYTLRYCFDCFELGGETGLRGQVMARICQELLGLENSGNFATGQAWYDAEGRRYTDF